MMLPNEQCIYRILSAVYREGAYLHIELDRTLRENPSLDRAYITRVCYGVLENEIRFEFALGVLVEKQPKQAIKPILKIGMYLLEDSHTPAYAVVQKCVELAKLLGKGGAAGFVNAVLRRFIAFEFPKSHPQGIAGDIAFRLNIPVWLAQKLLMQYTQEDLHSMRYTPSGTHVRFVRDAAVSPKIESSLKPDCLKLGYYVSHDIMETLDPHVFTPQSLSSMVAVHAYLETMRIAAIDCTTTFSVLDLCAAPGGKSIYLKELAPQADIIACDVHAHRTELMKAYAKRMNVKMQIAINDASLYREDWEDKFDLVICDVPCSGLGVLATRPDIILNRTENSLQELQTLQKSIVSCASRYVRRGGVLCYSTCTVLADENENIIEWLLKQTPCMQQIDITKLPICQKLSQCGQRMRDKAITILPDQNGFDGFFVAAARRCHAE